MITRWLRIFCFVIAIAGHQSTSARQADFNEVGKQMAIMLQNSHFSRLPFSIDLSQRFLESYIKSLDPQRLYFTQQDVDMLGTKYGGQLHNLLLNESCMEAANDIYEVFTKRVEERLTQSLRILSESEFDFTVNESVLINRKNAPWVKSEVEATELWRLQTKKSVLSNLLLFTSPPKSPGDSRKEFDGTVEKSPTERVVQRHKRKLNELKTVDEGKVASLFLSSIARSYDPHTDYLSFREMNRFKDSMKNELVGIGVQLQTEGDGAVRISGIVKGGPADRNGVLKLSDRIVAVDAHNTGRSEDMVDIIAMDLDKVVDLIQGDVGTAVALKIEPAQTLHGVAQVTIVARDKVKQKDSQARAQVIIIDAVEKSDKRLGVITLPTFYADFDDGKIGCSADVEKLLIRLMREEIDGLAVDLRGNPGGSLEEVRKIASFFIGNCPVVQVKNTLGQVQVKDSGDTKPIYFGPMIIITDEGSASASEILAGALQDCNRAVIVGNSSTFGKGTVQEPKDIGSMLPYFAARDRAGSLKLTIQKFYRPSGSSTQIEGVIPHISFPNIPDENVVAEKYLDHALPYDRIRPAAKFSPLNIQSLFIPDLQRLSQSRLESNKDFSYAAEDLVKNKSKSSSDHLSLNKAIRERELEESYQLEKDRNLERKIRFIKIAEEDRKVFKFFKISLDDVDNPIELKECLTNNEGGEYMRLEANNAKDLDKPLAFPSGLDPVKRESIQILCDLIDLTERERIAGVLNGKIDSN